jgi:hypothetical protein
MKEYGSFTDRETAFPSGDMPGLPELRLTERARSARAILRQSNVLAGVWASMCLSGIM